MREYLSCIICDDPLVYMQEKIESVYSNFHDGCVSIISVKNCSDSMEKRWNE